MRKEFTLPNSTRFFRVHINLILFYGFLLILILITIDSLLEIFQGTYQTDRLGEIPSFFFVGMIMIPTLLNFSLGWKIQENKLYAKYFIFVFKWFEVNKSNIRSVSKLNPPWNQQNDLWIVTISRLTIWHRFLGALHGKNWNPTLVVTSKLTDHEELVDILKEMC